MLSVFREHLNRKHDFCVSPRACVDSYLQGTTVYETKDQDQTGSGVSTVERRVTGEKPGLFSGRQCVAMCLNPIHRKREVVQSNPSLIWHMYGACMNAVRYRYPCC